MILLTALLICIGAVPSSARQRLPLGGSWQYLLLDSVTPGVDREGTLALPGTLDTNGIGIPVKDTGITDQLSRRVTYKGPVRFTRTVDIPEDAAGKDIILHMERTRPTTVKVDGHDAGSLRQISSPQRYDLTPFLSPGSHTIEIIVDNGEAIPSAVRNSSHACSESTQTNWNGIIGQFYLEIINPVHIDNLSFIRYIPEEEEGALTPGYDPDTDNGFIISGTITRNSPDETYILKLSSENTATTLKIDPSSPNTFRLALPIKDSDYSIGRSWCEINPELHDIEITLTDSSGKQLDRISRRSGMGGMYLNNRELRIANKIVFLRGRHDACVWPLTGHVPMDKESWTKYFSILKEYGLNHVRFHSWCPPEACFEAADEAGFYLQPELPIWGEIDADSPELLDFLNNDMEGILRAYSHHPSFVMFAIGNELWGDIKVMRTFIDRAREINPSLLATYGSNIYLGNQGHIPGEDFLVTCRVGSGEGTSTHARASFSFADADNGGIMNSTTPNTAMTFEEAISRSEVPVIGHETGQYQFYPDFKSISKYKGVLRPDNLVEFLRRAIKSGTLRKAEKFYRASGEWATRLYLADLEMNLRTPGMGGFQLLDIQDYPGQGTALVGILDPFMDSKGFITPEKWRQSCDDVTLLALLPKRTFIAGEEVAVPVKIVNCTQTSLPTMEVECMLDDKVVAELPEHSFNEAILHFNLPQLDRPRKMLLKLRSIPNKRAMSKGEREITNSYDIWVYPEETPDVKGVLTTKSLSQALEWLQEGKRVILTPDSATAAANTLGPLFQTDYWNYRMFKTICDKMQKPASPGTLGLLIDDSHPALEFFPTDFHTDWQWFSVISNSRPLIVDRLPASVDPIIEPIDNVERALRLALMLECNVGKGKLLLVMTDLDKTDLTPEGRWFRYSLERYVASKEFRPTLSLTPQQLKKLLTEPSAARKIEAIRNISY